MNVHGEFHAAAIVNGVHYCIRENGEERCEMVWLQMYFEVEDNVHLPFRVSSPPPKPPKGQLYRPRDMGIFHLFDVKRKGVIDFGDFVRGLNVKQMLIAFLCEFDMTLADETIEIILDKGHNYDVSKLCFPFRS
nr:Calcineurin B-like protein 1 [Ipomoea batatas]